MSDANISMYYKWKAKILTHFHSLCLLPTLCSHIKLSQSLPHVKMSSSINIPCQTMRTDDRRKGNFSTELFNRWISAFPLSFRIGLILSEILFYANTSPCNNISEVTFYESQRWAFVSLDFSPTQPWSEAAWQLSLEVSRGGGNRGPVRILYLAQQSVGKFQHGVIQVEASKLVSALDNLVWFSNATKTMLLWGEGQTLVHLRGVGWLGSQPGATEQRQLKSKCKLLTQRAVLPFEQWSK